MKYPPSLSHEIQHTRLDRLLDVFFTELKNSTPCLGTIYILTQGVPDLRRDANPAYPPNPWDVSASRYTSSDFWKYRTRRSIKDGIVNNLEVSKRIMHHSLW